MATSNKIDPDFVLNSSEMGDLDTMMRRFVFGLKSDLNICIPAVVRSYDRGAKKAVVVPLVKLKYVKDGKEEYVIKGELNVRVRQICYGGFAIDLPLFVGDTGWVISSDVDTSILRQHGNDVCKVVSKDLELENVQNDLPQVPGTNSIHDLENGFFIPDCWAAFTPGNVNAGDKTVGETALYIGESVDETCTIDDQGVSSLAEEKDGLASISISRGKDDAKGSVTISVGKSCFISVDGKDGDETIRLSVGEECNLKVTKEKVSIECPELELPENTTVGGKHFTEQALS